jgi:hypothetical protein
MVGEIWIEPMTPVFGFQLRCGDVEIIACDNERFLQHHEDAQV